MTITAPPLTRRDFLKTAALAAAASALPTHAQTAAAQALQAAKAKPNIILLMADDLGFGDVGFNGNKEIKTPHLDRMAAGGIRFTRFYSVGPVCSPTRACVQTGRHCLRFGMINVNVGKLPAGEITIARVCKAAGYTTGHFGKWHLGTMSREHSQVRRGPAVAEGYGPPWERGYDTTFTTETNIATWDPQDYTGLRIPKHSCTFWSNGKKVPGKFSGSSERIIMDRALPFIARAAADKKPFMTTIWFYGPHSPVRAGKALRELYPNMPLGRQHYLGAITAIDQQVGRLRAHLTKLGLADNTLIFFCSDNGPEGPGKPGPKYNPYAGAWYGSAGEFRGRKRYLYNGGVCVPAFALWPAAIKPAQTLSEPACTLDYLPTIAAITRFTMPDKRPIDGTSILPLLTGRPWKRTKPIPFASKMTSGKNSPDATWIRGDFKFCTNITSAGQDALYHIHNDPAEQNNIIAKHPKLAAAMKAELLKWIESARHSYENGDYPGYKKQGVFLTTKKK